MNCNEEQIGLYIDGEVEEEHRRAMEAHFGECLSCRELHELWTKGDERMRSSVEPEEWDAKRKAILSRVGRKAWWGIPAGIAASFLVSILTVLLLTPRPTVDIPLVVIVEDPEKALVSGEAVIHSVMEDSPENPVNVVNVCNFIRNNEATEQLAAYEIDYKEDPELADGFRLLKTVYTRIGQMSHEPEAWEVRQIQKALKDSDAVDRMKQARSRMVMRRAQ